MGSGSGRVASIARAMKENISERLSGSLPQGWAVWQILIKYKEVDQNKREENDQATAAPGRENLSDGTTHDGFCGELRNRSIPKEERKLKGNPPVNVRVGLELTRIISKNCFLCCLFNFVTRFLLPPWTISLPYATQLRTRNIIPALCNASNR